MFCVFNLREQSLSGICGFYSDLLTQRDQDLLHSLQLHQPLD